MIDRDAPLTHGDLGLSVLFTPSQVSFEILLGGELNKHLKVPALKGAHTRPSKRGADAPRMTFLFATRVKALNVDQLCFDIRAGRC